MDDIVSIESVHPLDQLSFWGLTISAMLKLVAMGVTIFVLPFNEWILLQKGDTEMIAIRGISGSDCVFERPQSSIQCSRWDDSLEEKDKFWAKFGLEATEIDPTSGMFRSIFYLILLQLFLFLFDIGATLVMCCRYKVQKDGETSEKRISLAVSGTILFFYALVSLFSSTSNSDFTNSRPPFQSCMGTAFKLYCGMFLLFGLGCLLSHCSRLLVLREECSERRRQGCGDRRKKQDEEVQLR